MIREYHSTYNGMMQVEIAGISWRRRKMCNVMLRHNPLSDARELDRDSVTVADRTLKYLRQYIRVGQRLR